MRVVSAQQFSKSIFFKLKYFSIQKILVQQNLKDKKEEKRHITRLKAFRFAPSACFSREHLSKQILSKLVWLCLGDYLLRYLLKGFLFLLFSCFIFLLIFNGLLCYYGVGLLRLVRILMYLIRDAVICTSLCSHCNYLPRQLIIKADYTVLPRYMCQMF